MIRAAYFYDAKAASREAAHPGGGEELTRQSFKDDCDINVIMRRFGITGQAPGMAGAPSFDDFSAVPDFHTAMNRVREAQERFMALPSAVRDRFSNDPARLVDFLNDENNRAEAVSLGLVKPIEVVPPAAS